jgi:hypothetical protein
MMPDLAGCPFCGRAPEVSGGKVASCPDQDCPIYDWSMTPEEWCRRVPGPATVEILREMWGHVMDAGDMMPKDWIEKLDAFFAEWDWDGNENSRPDGAAGDGDGD